MDSPELALSVLAIAACLLGLAGFRRYGTPLNPLTAHCGLSVGLFTVISGIAALSRFRDDAPDRALLAAATLTTWCSFVHLLGLALAYASHGRRPARLFGHVLRALALDRVPATMPFRWSRVLFFLGLYAAAFVGLAVVGGGRWLWFTSPREAYLLFRAGAGPFFVLSQWALIAGFAYTMWYRRPRAAGLLFYLVAFGGPAYFTGSKSSVLGFCTLALAYYNFRVRKLTLAATAVVCAVLLGGAVGLLLVHGSYANAWGVVDYFAEYFGTTMSFLQYFSEFGFHLGEGWLSSFWFYVPRALYPDKPFEYGETLIHETLFPGSAAQGSTPGLLPWSLSYLDFGLLGVFANGYLLGLVQRATYDYYLGDRENLIAFLLMVQFGIWGVFALAPPVLLFAWLMLVSVVLRAHLLPLPTHPAYVGIPLRAQAHGAADATSQAAEDVLPGQSPAPAVEDDAPLAIDLGLSGFDALPRTSAEATTIDVDPLSSLTLSADPCRPQFDAGVLPGQTRVETASERTDDQASAGAETAADTAAAAPAAAAAAADPDPVAVEASEAGAAAADGTAAATTATVAEAPAADTDRC